MICTVVVICISYRSLVISYIHYVVTHYSICCVSQLAACAMFSAQLSKCDSNLCFLNKANRAPDVVMGVEH